MLMSQKADLLEKIDRLFQFEPQRQVDELPDMELKLSVLSRFSSVADAAEAVEPQYRGRLFRFILEQMEILSAMLQGTELPEQDTWAQQQLHLLRYRWGRSMPFLTEPAPMSLATVKTASRKKSFSALTTGIRRRSGGGRIGRNCNGG